MPERDVDAGAAILSRATHLSEAAESKAVNSTSKPGVVDHSTGSSSRNDLRITVCKLDTDHFDGLFFKLAMQVNCMPQRVKNTTAIGAKYLLKRHEHCRAYARDF